MASQEINSKNKIYSSFAKRLGCIVNQYEALQINTETKYETTLCVCVLQSLLTIYQELTKKKQRESHVDKFFDNQLPQWGLEQHFVISPSNGQNTLSDVLEHLRHSLSHPNPFSESLGYTTIDINDEPIIGSYQFAHQDFQMKIPVSNLRILVSELSNYLEAIHKTD
jgi:hypothetical protein